MPRSINTLGDVLRTGFGLIAVCGNIQCRLKRALDLREIVRHVGDLHPVLPARGHLHLSERLRCPRCGHRGSYVWLDIPNEPEPLYGQARAYQVNAWSRYSPGSIDTQIAVVGHVVVANAAFDSAVAEYRGSRITLQQGAYVLRDSRLAVVAGGKDARR